MPSGCPWHQKVTPTRKAIYTHTYSLTQCFIFLDCHPSKTDSNDWATFTSKVTLSPTMSTTAFVPAPAGCRVGQRQLSASALNLQRAASAQFFTPEWLASWPQRLCTCVQNYCGTRGIYCTVHRPCLCSVSGLLCWLLWLPLVSRRCECFVTSFFFFLCFFETCVSGFIPPPNFTWLV